MVGDFSTNHTDRKSTRLNSSHLVISYAVFCLKKKNHHPLRERVHDHALPQRLAHYGSAEAPLAADPHVDNDSLRSVALVDTLPACVRHSRITVSGLQSAATYSILLALVSHTTPSGAHPAHACVRQ